MPVESTELVLGRGDLYFGRFVPGTMTLDGEVYLGETMAFSIVRDITTLARMASYDGQKIAQESVVISETHSARFNTDNLTAENLALWYGGDPIELGDPGVANIDESLVVKRGRYYQMGRSVRANGMKNLANLRAYKAAVLLDLPTNFEINELTGRVYVRTDAADVADDDTIEFNYDLRIVAIKNIVSAKKELLGTFRFISTNRMGENKNVFFPYVHLKVEGELPLKSDEWQTLSFSIEARRLNRNTEFVYIETTGVGGNTYDEQAIIDGGMLLADFPTSEDMLNTTVNVDIPAHDY